MIYVPSEKGMGLPALHCTALQEASLFTEELIINPLVCELTRLMDKSYHAVTSGLEQP